MTDQNRRSECLIREWAADCGEGDLHQIPNERIVYFGDTARVPYGSKSKETITRYSRQIVRFFADRKVKAIVAACNTASAYALDEIEKGGVSAMIGGEPGVKRRFHH